MIQQHDFVQPEQLNFKDDGIFPNSPLPLLFYHQALTTEAKDPASIFAERFAENGWTNSWRNGVYFFPHYHSTSHEVLGVYSGTATLRLGGERGKNVEVRAGDVIVIPAGVAHQTSAPVTILALWEHILTDVSGISFGVFRVNDQRQIITSRLCRCRKMIRSTEPKARYREFGKTLVQARSNSPGR